MDDALKDFALHWQPRQRQSFGMIATLAVRLQNLTNNHDAWRAYDLPSIALAAVYLVVEPSRLAVGWTREQLIDALVPFAQAAGTGRPAAEPREVAAAVVDLMQGRSSGGAAFKDFYGDWTGGAYQHLVKPLEYLCLVGHEDDEPTIKAHPRAVNMFQGLYTLDLEDRNAADNFIVERQLARGDVDEVVATVRRQHMTMQALVDRIRDQIKKIRRDVRSVDYEQQVVPTIEGILTVLREQLHTADEFKARVGQRIEPGQPGERQLRETLRLLEHRCHELGEVLDEASRVKQLFEDEQDRQVWQRRQGRLHDSEATLFLPLIGMKVGALCELLEPVCAKALGVRRPRIWGALALVQRLAPKPRRVAAAPATNPFEVEDIQTPAAWITDELFAALQEVFAPIDRPTRLSELLIDAVNRFPTLCQTGSQASLTHLVSLVALTAFAPPSATEATDEVAIAVLARHRDLLDPDRITVINDRTPLTLPGTAGDDLLLQPVLTLAATASAGGE
ncbi:hypothetical protein GCM10010123_20470 [Pilimelia anulata]|uniref:Uncharacterized protein n=1 Tax=Pilimelia anulata TaxID=53371 RepID=A0A8J3B9B9_9ACTN|nr:hypothetical protein [Pilimelia anulata]GGJ90537.1 hypothetical protein GCM10010123_20470 [Pilimelia anulata]